MFPVASLFPAASRCDPSTQESSWSHPPIMPHLNAFIPALHHALVKVRANRPSNLSAGVEHQIQEYFSGLKDGSVRAPPLRSSSFSFHTSAVLLLPLQVRQHSMSEYDSILDEEGKSLPPPKHHQFSRDSYLHSYLSGPDLYLLPLVQAKHAVEAHRGPEPPQDPRSRDRHNAAGRGVQGSSDHRVKKTLHETRKHNSPPSHLMGLQTSKVQQLLDLVMTCKRNAENELRWEKGEGGGTPEKKRKLEQETAERALKYFKASQEPEKLNRTPGEAEKIHNAP